MNIRYTELFYSIQGEGMYVGVPSVFLRLWGCNLTCQGFAGTASNSIDASSIKRVEELNGADFSVGCDSRYSWHPDFKHLAKTEDTSVVAHEIFKLIMGIPLQEFHLVITGGEPMMQQKAIVELLNNLSKYFDRFFRIVLTIETNGSVEINADFSDLIHNKADSILWSLSPKLSHNGDPLHKRINAAAIESIFDSIYEERDNVQLKFVVSNESHVEELNGLLTHSFSVLAENPVYLMPLGGSLEDYQANALNVAHLALKHGYRYSPRLHVDLFGNSVGT